LLPAVSSNQGTRTAARAAAAGGHRLRFVAAATAAATAVLATVAHVTVVNAQEDQEVFVEEGGVVGIGMIAVIVATAVPTFFCGALAVVANSPQNTAKHRNTPQNPAKRRKTLQNAAKRRKTPQKPKNAANIANWR